jgi:NDP-4-keto-2,6-dideoxyhexose 3-C-methyltransferase
MSCIACGTGDLDEILGLGDLCLADFRDDDVVPPRFPLNLVRCLKCNLVQLAERPPSDLLYTERYGYKSGVNTSIRADLAEIVWGTSRLVDLQHGDAVLDIACNDGTLLSNYPTYLRRVGCDPVRKFAAEAIRHADCVLETFFNPTYWAERYKAITSISVFYAVPDPNEFVAGIKKILHKDGVWCCQQNYLGSMLANTAYCNIVHEHVAYYSLTTMQRLLNKHGLIAFRVEENGVNGGSFRTYIGHQGRFPQDSSIGAMLAREHDHALHHHAPYKRFADRVRTEAKRLRDVVEAKKGDVFLYGASTRANTFMQYSHLDRHLVPAAVERNPEKVGKKLSSLQIPIISEEEARERRPGYLLVGPWFFFDEFRQREQAFLGGGGAFILPLPTVRIEREAIAA